MKPRCLNRGMASTQGGYDAWHAMMGVSCEKPMGWDNVDAQTRSSVVGVIKYFHSLGSGTVALCDLRPQSDKSLAVCIFVSTDVQLSARDIKTLATTLPTASQILNVLVELDCPAPSTQTEWVGAIVVYIRTPAYNADHPHHAVVLSAAPTAAAAAAAPSLMDLPPPSLFFRHNTKGVKTRDRAALTDISWNLMLLQGPDLKASKQHLWKLGEPERTYQIQTFGYRAPLSIDDLDRATSLPYVTGVNVCFSIKFGDHCGALAVTCTLPHVSKSVVLPHAMKRGAEHSSETAPSSKHYDSDSDDDDTASDSDSPVSRSTRQPNGKRTASATRGRDDLEQETSGSAFSWRHLFGL